MTFGDNTGMQRGFPTLPPGLTWQQASAYGYPIALDSGGNATLIGDGPVVFATPPPLPPGTYYTDVRSGPYNSLALRSDGELLAWGNNSLGTCNVPPLPPGVTYVQACSDTATLAVRSDGALVGCGLNTNGQINIPALPPGVTYLQAAAATAHATALRSDGSAIAWGQNTYGQCNLPPLPPGVKYVEVAAAGLYTLGRRTDGQVVGAGLLAFTPPAPPSPPPGVHYVALAAGIAFAGARLSDGSIKIWGDTRTVDESMFAGESWRELSIGGARAIAVSGPTSTYVRSGLGCGGSAGTSELVPLDTPRLGCRQRVTLTNLPANAALLATGFSTTVSALGPLPLDLGPFGMPGCSLRIAPDLVTLVVGSDGYATVSAMLSTAPALLGMTYHQQALVLDPGANPAGAVLSHAASAVIGQ